MININETFDARCKRCLKADGINDLFELFCSKSKIKDETEAFKEIEEQVIINFDDETYRSAGISREELDIRLENVVRNILERLLFKEKLSSRPLVMHIEVTKRCNASCIMCGRVSPSTKESRYRYKKIEYKDMPIETYKKAVTFFPYIQTLGLFGWGEPLVSKYFFENLEFARKHKVMTTFTTNATLLDDKFLERIRENNFIKEINISFDGSSEEVFEQIRRGVKFKEVIDKIQRINSMKHAGKRKFPYLNFVFVAMKRNIDELLSLINLSSELQIKAISVIYLTAHSEGMREESLFYHQGLANTVFTQAKKKATAAGINLILPPLFKEDDKGNTGSQDLLRGKCRCFDPWSLIIIDNEGNVKPCCSYEGSLGKLGGELLSDIWNNKGYQDLRRTHGTRESMGSCNTCVKYADVDEESTHVHLV